jgi:hypothetical protein
MKKKENDIEKVKEELRKAYNKHLDKIFAPETFNLSFDEREKLIDEAMLEERNDIIEEHIEKDPKGTACAPVETCMCPCGTEAPLCKDKDGSPRIFEREIKTKSGPIKVKEYGYYCSKDRKIFFPSPKNP